MSVPALEAIDVRKHYGQGEARFHALSGVSLSIAQGESAAITGKSGSGKSTLMHLLALLDSPASGQIRVAGTDASSLRPREVNHLRNASFGFVFQQFFMIPTATVLENVSLPLKIKGVPARERRERSMQVLEQVELADKASNRATALSGGQKQRAVIARALANEPDVIFADEPTGNLDTATGTVIEDLLFSLNAESGITLVIVTHDPDLASRCRRRIHLRDGLIVGGDAQ